MVWSPARPQWLRPFLAALAGYVVFPTVWLPLARLFEPEFADDHGSPALNLLSDLVTGLGFALTGVMFLFGLAFIGLGTLWGRVQLALLRQFKVDTWIVSAMIGALAGWTLSLGFSWLLADLSGSPRDQIGAMIAGAVAGAVAGSLLVVQPRSPRRRKSP